MIKFIPLGSRDGEGTPRVHIAVPHRAGVKVAADMTVMPPAMAEFWTNYDPNPDKFLYVHINIVGAFEFWGPNSNGDAFLEKDIYDDPCYKTFMSAKPYVLHNNKDPKLAIGDVTFSDYNLGMHRIEVISALDRDNAKAIEIEAKINSGNFMDVSMGCKIPYDVCHICEHRAKTRAEYCDHAMDHMLQYWPYNEPQTTGKITCVENPNADFFDQSFVFTRAGKDTNIIQKLAYDQANTRKNAFIFTADLGESLFYKLAEEKKDAEIEKTSPDDITKDIPLTKEQKDVLREEGNDRDTKQTDIPVDVLKELAGESDEDIFSTSGLMGIRIEPKEYTIIKLIRNGQEPAAVALSKRTVRIEIPKLASNEEISPMAIKFNQKVASILRPYLEKRSFHTRFASAQKKTRRIRSVVLHKQASEAFLSITCPMDYRRNIEGLYKAARELQEKYFSNSTVLAETHGNVDAFMKTGCVQDNTMLMCLARMAGPTQKDLSILPLT
jgi:hypothetical protein